MRSDLEGDSWWDGGGGYGDTGTNDGDGAGDTPDGNGLGDGYLTHMRDWWGIPDGPPQPW